MARREDAREWLTRKANLAWQKRADIMRPSSMRSRASRLPHMSSHPFYLTTEVVPAHVQCTLTCPPHSTDRVLSIVAAPWPLLRRLSVR